MEYIDGQTLSQWMVDHPKPSLDSVRDMVQQIAKGLQAFHRKEMLHQDLRPENIMIDRGGTVKIIDFGAVHVAGLAEAAQRPRADAIVGSLQYTAPEYFIGDGGGAHTQENTGRVVKQARAGVARISLTAPRGDKVLAVIPKLGSVFR